MKRPSWAIAGATFAASLAGCGGNVPGPIGVSQQPLLVTGIPASSLMYDAALNRILAIQGNTVDVVDPTNGKVTGTISLNSETPMRKLSTEGEYLYEGGGTTLRRYNLTTGAVDLTIVVWPGITGSEASAVGMSGIWSMPNDPTTIIVQRSFSAGVQEPQMSLAKFTNGLMENTMTFPGLGIGVSSACFNQTGTTLFCIVANYLVAYSANLTEMHSPVALGNYGLPLSGMTEANGKLLLGSSVYSEQTLSQIGNFGTTGQSWASIGIPNKNEAVGFCQGTATTAAFIAQIDLDSYKVAKQWPLPNLPNPTGFAGSLTYAGPKRVALLVQDKQDTNMRLAIFTSP